MVYLITKIDVTLKLCKKKHYEYFSPNENVKLANFNPKGVKDN